MQILILLCKTLGVQSSGCDFDPNSIIFIQEETTDNPIKDWGWKWTKDIDIVPNNVGWPSYKYMPDGHISAIKVFSRLSNLIWTFYFKRLGCIIWNIRVVLINFWQKIEESEEVWYIYYPNSGSYRTIGHSPLSEATEVLDPNNVIIGNSNGRWRYF